MTRIQYRASLPPPAPTLATISGGSLTAAKTGTWYFWLQTRCRGGYTTLGDVASIAVSTGNQIQVTLPATIRTPASDVQEVYILAALANTPLSASVVAVYPGYDSDIQSPLPATVTLSRDAHLDLLKTAVNDAVLPAGADRVNGMRRYVDSVGLFKSWNAADAAWEVCRPQSFNTYVSSTLSVNGCDRDLKDITDQTIILYPSYSAEGNANGQVAESLPIDFWLVNDGDVAIPRGERIRMAVSTDLFDILSDDFKGLLNLEFLGYSQLSTGVLDTAIEGAGAGKFQYQGDQKTNLKLPVDLPSGWAYTLRVTGAFTDYQLDGGFPQGAILKYYPRIAVNSSVYNPAGLGMGDYIAPVGRMRRILPSGTGLNLIATDGAGCVAEYNWDRGESSISFLAPATANQLVVVSNTGACFVASTVSDATAKRAVVGTVNGVGSATAWLGSVALNSATLLKLTLTHPSTIRGTYPDRIAGMVAEVNSSVLRVYVRKISTTEIFVFEANITGVNGEVINVGAVLEEEIAALPAVTSNFGLFLPNLPIIGTAIGPSAFESDTYEVAIAYYFEDTPTTISHSLADDCIVEFPNTVEELFRLKELGELKGDKGDQGNPGVQGIKGDKGDEGPTGGAAFTRTIISATTASLATGATGGLSIPLGKSFQLLKLETSVPAWIRLYTTPAKRTADASRILGQVPTGEHGVITEDVTITGQLTIDYMSLGLFIFGASMESTPSVNIAASVTNRSGSTQAITVTFIRIEREV